MNKPKSLNFKGVWIPILLGVALSFGNSAARFALIPLRDPAFYIQTVVYSALCSLAFLCIDVTASHNSANAVNSKHCAFGRISGILRFDYEESLQGVLKDALKIIACWLPVFILLFPGAMYWDTGDQLSQFFGISAFGMPEGQIWDHHPWFSTYLYGLLTKLGLSLNGSFLTGLALNAMVQYFLAAVSFSWSFALLKRKGVACKCVQTVAMFVCFFPVIPIMLSTMSKDVSNAVVFIFWCVLFFKLADGQLEPLRKPWFFLLFFLTTLAVSLTKKMGLYVILAAIIALLLFHAVKTLKTILVSVAVFVALLINVIFPLCLYPVLNIVPGGSQAAIVMPIELLARVAKYYPNDVTEEERAVIDSYLIYSWEQMGDLYNPYITDPVTGYNLKGEVPFSDFIKVWIRVGLRHPLTYMNAFFSLESGWISFAGAPSVSQPREPYPQYPLFIEPVFCSSFNQDTFGKLSEAPTSSIGQDIMSGVFDVLKVVPGVNLLFYISTWTSIVPSFVLFVFVRRKGIKVSGWQVVLPYWISGLSLFVYPVSLSAQRQDPTRYMFHMVLLAPLMVLIVMQWYSDQVGLHIQSESNDIV